VFTNRRWVSAIAWVVTAAIIALNAELLWLTFRDLSR
jgi:Mn2+/Fe2+ NRAMP family transporter